MSNRPTFQELYRARLAAGQEKRDARQAKIDAKKAQLRAGLEASQRTPAQIEASQEKIRTQQEKTQARQEKISAGKAKLRAGLEESRNATFRTHGKALGVKSADTDRLLAAGALAAVETGADVHGRVTATRLVTLGVFALAARKQAGHVYITFDTAEGTVHVVKVDVKHEAKARKWAAEFNQHRAS
jgi:hypothetical protein